MKSFRLRLIVLMLAALVSSNAIPAFASNKKGFKLKVDKNEAKGNDGEMAKGSFMVASQCPDCNNGYQLSQVTFSGYDKPHNSASETFFITNNTDRTLTGVNLYIDYRTPDGRQLHKRFYPLRCNIPPGETRQAQLKSWDSQRSFVYIKSKDNGKNPGTPYDIIFDPVCYYLSF